MNRAELIKSIATKMDVSQGEATKVLSIVEETITEGIKQDGSVKFMDITLALKGVKAKEGKMGRNPKTGESVQVAPKPAHNKLTLKVGKSAKELFA
jgi:nucleoid DNA-binding protein